MNLKELGVNLLKAGAPTIGLALGGPTGAVVAKALAGRIGAKSDSPDDIDAALRETPVDMEMLDREMKHEIEMAALKAAEKTDLATIDLNKQDSKSGKLFVAGWRPAIGWTAATGLAYHFVWRPLLNGLVVVFGGDYVEIDGVAQFVPGPANAFPDIDAPGLLALTATLLGASGIRMFESLRGVKRNNLSE